MKVLSGALLTSALVGGFVSATYAQSVSDTLISQIVAAASTDPVDDAARPSQPAVFKSGVDLVALNVVVTDTQKKYVTDLGRQDFAVYEDGVQQDVAYFATSDVPLDLAILLDVSASMGDKLQTVQQAAIGFARSLAPKDRGAIIEFNDGVRVAQDFTSDVSRLEAAINGITTRGGTAMHNAIYVTLKQFQKTANPDDRVCRQAIVLLSDGQDTASPITFEDVLEVARRSGVSVYTISLASRIGESSKPSRRRYFSQNDYSMKTLALETGAQAFFPLQIEELSGVYGQIATELSHQYSIGYHSKNFRRDGGFRRLVVRVVNRPDVRPRTRTGYFGLPEIRASMAAGSK